MYKSVLSILTTTQTYIVIANDFSMKKRRRRRIAFLLLWRMILMDPDPASFYVCDNSSLSMFVIILDLRNNDGLGSLHQMTLVT